MFNVIIAVCVVCLNRKTMGESCLLQYRWCKVLCSNFKSKKNLFLHCFIYHMFG